jgi:hypothetical protein
VVPVARILVRQCLGVVSRARIAAVLAAFRAGPDDPLAAILERADRAARPTRGAAATVARIDLASGELAIAGVGNVAPWMSDPAHSSSSPSTARSATRRRRTSSTRFIGSRRVRCSWCAVSA